MTATEEPIDEYIVAPDPLEFNSAKDCTTVDNVLLVDKSAMTDFSQYANPNTFVICYQYENTIDQVMEVLTPRFTKIKRVAMVQHYSPNPFFLHNKSLFGIDNRNALVKIIQTFQVDNLDFLACRTLTDPLWVKLYDYLESKTSVVVGASIDNTGNLKYGGNWVMENTNQNIKAIYFNSTIGEYASLLDSITISYTDSNSTSYSLTYTYTVGGTTANVSSSSLGTSSTIVTIPSSITDSVGNSYSVTYLNDNVFYLNNNIAEINLPTTLTNIGKRCFYDCTYLTDVNGLENTSVTALSVQAFSNAGSNASEFNINISNIKGYGGAYIFKQSKIGPNLTFPTSVNFQVANGAFSNCLNIETVTIGSITRGNSTLGVNVFKGCTNLHTVVLESGTTYIGGHEWFEDCTSLTNVTLPDTIQTFNETMFAGCTSLTKLSFPSTFTGFISSARTPKQFITDNNIEFTFENTSSFPNISSMQLTETATVFISNGISSTNTNLVSFKSAHPNVQVRYFVSETVTISGETVSLSPAITNGTGFSAGTRYVFDQSDSSNTGNTLVFSREENNMVRYFRSSGTNTATTSGTKTTLDLSSDFSGNLYYYLLDTSSLPSITVQASTTVENSVNGNNVEMSSLATQDLTDTSVVGSTTTAKRSYTRTMIELFAYEHAGTLSNKRMVIKSGAVLPGYSDSLTKDTIVLNVTSSVDTTFNSTTLTKTELLASDVYVMMDVSDNVTLPSLSDNVVITKTGDTTYSIQTLQGTTTHNALSEFEYDGLVLKLGSVQGSLNMQYVDLLFTNHLNESFFAGSVFSPSLSATVTADATVTCTGPAATTLQNTFYFQADNFIATDPTDDLKYYVDTSNWSNILTDLNASTNGTISVADGGFVTGESIAESFLRHISNQLFGTYLAVDLFNNESTIRAELESQCGTVASNISSALSAVGVTGTDSDLSGSSPNYFLDDNTAGTKNVGREIFNQLMLNATTRFGAASLASYEMDVSGYYKMPFEAGDTLSYIMTINPASDQDTSVPTGGSSSNRTFKVKLVLQ